MQSAENPLPRHVRQDAADEHGQHGRHRPHKQTGYPGKSACPPGHLFRQLSGAQPLLPGIPQPYVLMEQVDPQGIRGQPIDDSRRPPLYAQPGKRPEKAHSRQKRERMVVLQAHLDPASQPSGAQVYLPQDKCPAKDQQAASQVQQKPPPLFLQERDAEPAHIRCRQENAQIPEAVVSQRVHLQAHGQHALHDAEDCQQQGQGQPQLLFRHLFHTYTHKGQEQVQEHVGRHEPVMPHGHREQHCQQIVDIEHFLPQHSRQRAYEPEGHGIGPYLQP